MTNLHVNNVLSYISSARETLSATVIINVASTFYESGLVSEAKDFLYGLLDVRAVRRKAPDAKKKDILDGFETAEQEAIALPTFVARGLQALQPSSGFEALVQMVSDIRDEITTLNGKVNTCDSLNMKQVLNEMAEMKKKVEKLEKRSQTQQPVDQPRNGSRTERTAVTPRFNEVVKTLKE